jgi:lysophospholipase L1-like esterase
MRVCFRIFAALSVAVGAVVWSLPGWAGASSAQCGDGGPVPIQCNVIFFDGDSISAGQGSSPEHNLDVQHMQVLGLAERVYNVAQAGRPVFDCLANFDLRTAPLKDTQARTTIILFHAGDNDIAKQRTGAETYEAFTRYVALAHAHGWKLVVSTEIPRLDFAPAQAAELVAYNRRLVENTAGADVVVDLGQDPRFADLTQRPSSPIFGGDRIHPNDAGYHLLAQKLAESIRPLLR